GENFGDFLMALSSQGKEPPGKSGRFMLPQAIKLDPTLDEAKITVAMSRLDAIWDQLFPAEQTRIVKLLVEKVIVSPNVLKVRLRANGIERLVLELRPEPVEQQVEALA
ncbi:hypothetical protein WB794_05400, partial [Denitratimonas tolerans]